jgi:phage head maturation protease
MNIKDTETLIAFGGEVKALGDGKVGGYLVRFTNEEDLDLEGEFFNKETDYGDPKPVPPTGTVYYQHGKDVKVGKRKLGTAKHKLDEFGVWAEAQLNLRDEYEKFIYAMAKMGKIGWSSATASHLVERESAGKATWIKSWPLGLDDTLTPVPAEPRNEAIPLKSWQPEELGVTLAERMEILNEELETIISDIRGVVGDDKPLNQVKQVELSKLLEMFSGMDEVRTNIQNLLDEQPYGKRAASRRLRYQLAEKRKTLTAMNTL